MPFFPEDATFILCGFLIQGNMVKPLPALLVIYVGVLIADFILYLFGRKYCRMAVCHRWFHKILPPVRLALLEDKFKKKGSLFILFGRHFIGLRAQIFIVSGIMRMHPLKFLLTDAFTVTFTIAVMVAIGYVGGHSLKDIGIDTSKLTYVVVFLFLSFFIGYLLINYMRRARRQ
ncbi:MAG: DedA family protein [Dissulfurispiraceae bacterium]